MQYGLKLRKEEVNLMEKLTNELLSELNCNTAIITVAKEFMEQQTA